MAHVFYVEHNSPHAKLITEELMYEHDIEQMTNVIASGPLHSPGTSDISKTVTRTVITNWRNWMKVRPQTHSPQYRSDTVRLTRDAIIALLYLEWNQLRDHCDKFRMAPFSCLLLTKVIIVFGARNLRVVRHLLPALNEPHFYIIFNMHSLETLLRLGVPHLNRVSSRFNSITLPQLH